jgi:hypothetical protein
MRATCTAHIILLHLIILTVLGEDYYEFTETEREDWTGSLVRVMEKCGRGR